MRINQSQNIYRKYDRPKKVKDSYGIILIRKNKNVYESLLIKKRVSYAYTEFILSNNISSYDDYKIMTLLNAMTFEEKLDIISLNFGQIWYRFCLSNPENLFDREILDEQSLKIYLRCKNNYESAFTKDGGKHIRKLVGRSKDCRNNWEIPKGRKLQKENETEKDMTCAIREVYEETGLKYGDYNILFEVDRIQRTTNTNKIQYNDFYFVADVLLEAKIKFPKIEKKAKNIPEITDISWMTINDMIALNIDNRIIDLIKLGISKIKKKYKQTPIYNIQAA